MAPGKSFAIVKRIDLALAALVIIVFMLDRALMTFKWLLLLRARGIHPHFFRAMKIYCASMVWGMFLPSTVGADTIRAVSLVRTGINTNEVVASIVIERVFGFVSTLFVGLCSLLLPQRMHLLWLGGVRKSARSDSASALVVVIVTILDWALMIHTRDFELLL